MDRNLVSADSIRERLNNLVNDVRLALLDPQIISDYMRLTSTTEEDFAWTQCLSNEEIFGGDFFQDFAGQGRTHWHYGVAHPILCGIETKFMADYGRDWLRQAYSARLAMVVGSRNINGLKMFDPRMIWQITSSLYIVCGSVGGAFILSCKVYVTYEFPKNELLILYDNKISHLQWDLDVAAAATSFIWLLQLAC